MKNKDVKYAMQCCCFLNLIKICIQKHVILLKVRKLLLKCLIYLFYTQYLHAEINRYFDKFILKNLKFFSLYKCLFTGDLSKEFYY